MEKILLFLIIGLLGVWLGRTLAMRRMRGTGETKRDSLEAASAATQQRKREAKRRILELLHQRERITNNDTEELLGVSDATATRYLHELEGEGKIVQKGETGRGVYYELIQG